ncbi:MAG: hypothetical protein R3242_07705 [Akkermansiaceae bacterium]|nr:hypothetical protein [Akkermansiaceae bacterium]
MAWRIDEAVIHGELDNTVEGRTTGKIWLVGREAPLELELDGDAWRDLAGTRLKFYNRNPIAHWDSTSLETRQLGIVGDMTASRRRKVPTVSDEEFTRLYEAKMEIPTRLCNLLYLEWFSETNGRVVLESADYELDISDHVWEMDEDADEAQKLANLNAMRDFMAQVIRRREPSGEDEPVAGELDEYAWEERLKESDRLTDAYQEVLEKYMEDADSEQKEAFVMGWDGLLDAMAEREECESELAGEEEDANCFEGEEGFEGFGEHEAHPLQAKAQELAVMAMDLVQRDAGQGSPDHQLVTCLLQVSGKLAGALNVGDDEPTETGYVLAVLKRCIHWLNQAVGACRELMTREEDPDQLAALAHTRSCIFEIRDGITELRRELK